MIPLFRQNQIDFVSGITTKNFLNEEMKLKDFFAVLNVLGEYLHATLDVVYSGFILFTMIIDSVV